MTDADIQLLTETKDRAKFFQTVQAWPLDDELNYIGWLSNFDEGEERSIACSILDFFSHYSKKMVNQMLQTSVAKSGHFFNHHFSDWRHSNFLDRCIYSFIPGEVAGPADSGNLFARKLRDELHIPEMQIVNYNDLQETLDIFKKPVPIVFVDDFVGSGQQVLKAWTRNKFSNGLTLKEICERDNHCAVYAPLIVNSMGFEVIRDQCQGLNLCTNHVLGPEYNLFNQDCICWKNDPELFKNGVDLILKKSKLLGIPSTNGCDERDEKGYGMQGLAISFEHGAPDAVPAIFYWTADNWTPLIIKPYQR